MHLLEAFSFRKKRH